MTTLGRLRAAIKLANNVAASGTPDESTLAEGVVVQEQHFENEKARSESKHDTPRRLPYPLFGTAAGSIKQPQSLPFCITFAST